MTNNELKYFTQTDILRQIGPKRLVLLLRDFAEDLNAGQLVLPSPEVHNGDYFVQLAAAFAATERLPERLRVALLTLEEAASPENERRVWSAIRRRIPGVSVSQDCALDRTLELWFLARDEFSQFAVAAPRESAANSPTPTAETDLRRSAETPLRADSSLHHSTTPPLQLSETPSLHSSESDEQTLLALAQLSPTQYDRARQGAAQRLGIRMETLDSEVARRRADVQARAVKLPLIEPWPESVDGAEVLHQVAARFSLHVVLPPGAAHAIALWDAHAHAFEAFLHTPRLNLSSPEPEWQDHHA